ncbi:hypothetical protein HDE_07767 [Halotydeus destructor]|nr:hypothetical protein HDE_07767 [Halotydeus destructor]
MKSAAILTVILSLTIAGSALAYDCYQCEDRCITYSWRCDGEVDCPLHAEDERDCEYICPYQTHHRCSDTGLCMDNGHLCDGNFDCINGEDETNCYKNSWVGKNGAKTNVDLKGLDKADHGAQHFYGQDGIRVNQTINDIDRVNRLLYANRVNRK